MNMKTRIELYSSLIIQLLVFQSAMADIKRLSGAQNRKRRAERQKVETKQKGSFLKYLCTSHTYEEGPELDNQNEADNEAEDMSISEELESQNETHGRHQENISEVKTSLVYVLTMATLLLGQDLMTK